MKSCVTRQSTDNRIIRDDDVEAALSWLRDSAQAIGKAKERTVKAGHVLRHIEALEFKMSEAKSAEAKKADARTSERYLAAIDEDAQAAGEYERMKALREAAALVIESWRSEGANFRAMRI